MYLHVMGIDFDSIYDFILYFGTFPTVWYFLFLILFVKNLPLL